MLAITRTAADRIDIRLSGQIDAETMHRGLDDILTLSADIEGGRLFYEILAVAMPTLGAIGVKMQYLPKLFGLLGRFDRCAVVSDAPWVRAAAEIEGALFPGIEIKAFMPSEHAAAEAWLAEGASAPA